MIYCAREKTKGQQKEFLKNRYVFNFDKFLEEMRDSETAH